MDPLAGSPWGRPETVAGFVESPPNDVLLQFARRERQRRTRAVAIDLGCGAGRNAIPLAESRWTVMGTDLSRPMADAAMAQAAAHRVRERLQVVLAPMDRIPCADASFDLVVAHGIWNLARSSAEFRRAVAEAARVARPEAGVFVFTFSRHTVPEDATPVHGEPFVFTQFSGEPQCFLTEAQLIDEMSRAGFDPDAAVPLTERNRPRPGSLLHGGPVIYEGAFRRRVGALE